MTKIRLDQIDTDSLAAFVNAQVPVVLGSAAQSFTQAISSGQSFLVVSYPSGYPSGIIPKVFVSVHSSDPTDPLIFHSISGATRTSFGLMLSNAVSSANYSADILTLR